MFLLVRSLIFGSTLALLAPLALSQNVDPELQPGNPHFNPFKFADELIQRRDSYAEQNSRQEQQPKETRFYDLPVKKQEAIKYGVCSDSLITEVLRF